MNKDQISLLEAFIREQREGMTPLQSSFVSLFSLIMATHQIPICDDVSVALRSIADYNDFVTGLRKP